MSVTKKGLVVKPSIKLLGISVRTNNKNEIDPEKAKIGELVHQFYAHNIVGKISNQVNPGTVMIVYTEYDSNEFGDYTCFIGVEVSSFESSTAGLDRLEIPGSSYQKFTTASGKLPGVVINAWKTIWGMSSEDLGGKRSYRADFEVYSQQSGESEQVSADIYIGLSEPV